MTGIDIALWPSCGLGPVLIKGNDMPARALTSAFCKAAKAEAGRQTSYPDTKEVGLELRVTPEGRRTWYYRYRTRAGAQRRMSLGLFSSNDGRSQADQEDCFDLEAARREVRRLRVVVDKGGDPLAERQALRDEAIAEPIKTLGDLMTSYFEACEKGRWKPRKKVKRASTLAGERSVYRLHVEKDLGKLPLDDLTRAKIRRHLEKIADNGAGVQTNRAHSLIRGALQYAVLKLDRLPANPATGVEQVVTETPRTRVLTDAELRDCWHAIENPAGLTIAKEGADPEPLYLARSTAIALQLTMVLLQRRGEIAGMRSSELDLNQAVWKIPGHRMKGNRPHAVPLPPLAIELIKEAIVLAEERVRGIKDAPIFPGARDPASSIQPGSVSHAFRDILAALSLNDIHLHDVRRTGSTAMTSERLSVSPFIRSLVLSHSDTGGGATISSTTYDANSYLPEKRRALEAWERLLKDIVGMPADNVVELSRAG